MAATTKIEWTDSTFNPWWGCTKIAPACDHCYAAALDKRAGGNHWGNVPRRRTSEHNWNEPRRWQRKAAEFFAVHGRRQRVFCASMADVFDNQVPDEWRRDLWALIGECPDLDWLLLTKRPQNIVKMKPTTWDEIKGRIWLGTTVEDQDHADLNLPHLLQHGSAVRFVSCEPLLGPLDLRPHFDRGIGLDWVIAGGESGAGARPSHPDWFRSLRDQCAAAGRAYLFKQWGDWRAGEPDERGTISYVNDPARPPALMIRVGKAAAGRLLDGVEHNGFPTPGLAGFPMWVIYDHPKDFPDGVVARHWIGLRPTDRILEGPDLRAVRLLVANAAPNAIPVPRQQGDDPCIVEVWL